MRILFTVQGEGRGHLTQALALHEILSRSGHELAGVIAGVSGARELPEFFARGFPVSVTTLPSFGFSYHKNKGIDLAGTLWRAVTRLGTYRESLKRLRAIVRETEPDLIVNFFEPLTGLAQLWDPLPVPVLAVAHQHLIEHPVHERLPGRVFEQLGLSLFVRLVGFGSWKIALSFFPAEGMPGRRLFVCPPLLRRQLFELLPTPGDFLLAYVVNHGYAEEIRAWHRDHPSVPVHCFYDRPGAPEAEEVEPNLTFHRISGEKFLRMMAQCRGMACTAGFESVCEAAWLGKPILVVPVANHTEQEVNADETSRLPFGVQATSFDLGKLNAIPVPVDNSEQRAWISRAEPMFLRVLERVMEARHLTPVPSPLQERGVALQDSSTLP